jgi:large subunit ribosomal protein L23
MSIQPAGRAGKVIQMADKNREKANAKTAAKAAKTVGASSSVKMNETRKERSARTAAKIAKTALVTAVVAGRDPFRIIKHPHLAEKSMNMVETANMLVFIVDRRASKADIKAAVEKGFSVQVSRINVTITRDGDKKAYVKLKDTSSAADVASRLGMI